MQVQDRTDGRRINVHDAVIRSATVEIKALTVSGKQVTLAVFRQLPESALIVAREDGYALAGVPWGRVNYHPDGCKDVPFHLHVVWQYRDELLRARVGARLPDGDMEEWKDSLGDLAHDLIADTAAVLNLGYRDAAKHLGFSYDQIWTNSHPGRWSYGIKRTVEGVKIEREVVYDDAVPRAHMGAAERYDEAIREYRGERLRYFELFDTLKMIDQLFIAV